MRQITIIALIFSLCVSGVAFAMPLQQSNLSATPISPSQVSLVWYHQLLSSGAYAIYRETLSASGTCGLSMPIENIIATLESTAGIVTHQYTDNYLTTGISYCYLVRFQSHIAGHSNETVTWGPSVATPLQRPTPTATSTRTPTPTSTPTVTGTPIATSTPAPYIPATIAPPELQTLSNQCVVSDYHFMTPSQMWNKSAGAHWTYSRWVLSSTESINQVVSFPSAGQYVMSIRASSSITPALISVSVFSNTYGVYTTRTGMTSYAITVTVPNTDTGLVQITAPTNSGLTLDRVCLIEINDARAHGLMAEGGAFAVVDPAGNLDLSDFIDWFVPLELTPMFSNPFVGWDWNVTMSLVARLAMTLMVIMLPDLMRYYFAARIGLLAALWFFSFVAKRIGHPLPGGEAPVTIFWQKNWSLTIPKHLPSLGPSVLRGGVGPSILRSGRGRRGRGI